MTRKQLERKARKLAQKFYDDCQELFDAEDMDSDTADGAVFAALALAQGYADEAKEAE